MISIVITNTQNAAILPHPPSHYVTRHVKILNVLNETLTEFITTIITRVSINCVYVAYNNDMKKKTIYFSNAISFSISTELHLESK